MPEFVIRFADNYGDVVDFVEAENLRSAVMVAEEQAKDDGYKNRQSHSIAPANAVGGLASRNGGGYPLVSVKDDAWIPRQEAMLS